MQVSTMVSITMSVLMALARLQRTLGTTTRRVLLLGIDTRRFVRARK